MDPVDREDKGVGGGNPEALCRMRGDGKCCADEGRNPLLWCKCLRGKWTLSGAGYDETCKR